ncbi:hypothetical protein BH23BAC1_BH23BAC1_35190 [soil metagenome]
MQIWILFPSPFLFLTKLPSPQNPFRKLNLLIGTTIEYQTYIKSTDNLSLVEKSGSYIPNLSLGSRVSFREGTLGKIDMGLSFNYTLGQHSKYNLLEYDNSINYDLGLKAHFIKIEMLYFFVNSKSKIH